MLIATALAETVTENVSFLEGLWNNISPKLMDGTANFWETIYGEIYRNVIMEGRWLSYLKGLGVTLEVSFLAALVGVVLGTVLALMKLSKSSWLSKPASAYIHLIRSTPLLLQVLIINFGIFAAVNVDKIIVGVIACGLNSAAYVAELIRGGIESVDKGQTEAGRSLGLNGWQTMRLIVLPQALKTALPSLCNEFIVLIKETSVLAYIALTDLTKAADYIRSRTFSPFTSYIVSALLYLVVISIFTKLVGKLEMWLRRSDNR